METPLSSTDCRSPGRHASDHQQLRHARDRHAGFAVGRYLQTPPLLFTRDGHNVFLGDLYRGRSAFLICGGPSLASHNLELLNQRGVLTAAVNNAAVLFRPQLWITVDDPGNFCDGLWRDPGILKFSPLCHLEKRLIVRTANDELKRSEEERVGDMPGVFGYRRNETFRPEQFLYEDTFNWGNHSDRVDELGVKGSRSVFLVALRMLFYLGVRRVYLLGCDFRMRHSQPNYAFEQHRSRDSVNGNNATYRALNKRLASLVPHFEQEDFEVINCAPGSGLTVFDYEDFETAVERIAATIPPLNTVGLYDREARMKRRRKQQNETV